MLQTTAQILEKAGFHVGPPMPAPCMVCDHRWGEHILKAPGNPRDGGSYMCPYCECIGTWSLDPATRARMAWNEFPTQPERGCEA